MMKVKGILFISITLAPGFLRAEVSSDLARVGIIRFINNTNSDDFEWVEKSLPDAIDISMKARFEYVRLEETKVQVAAAQVIPGKAVPAGDGGNRYSKEDAAKIAKLAQAYILIYGNFVADQASEELVLHAVIFNAASNRVIGHVENRTPLNAKIFKNIDQMAAEIVAEIYRFALQSNQGSSYKNMKLLVLVPAFANADEEEKAKAELDHLKQELSVRNPGKYLTIYEFFDEYHVMPQEQAVSLGYAKLRERTKLQLWLENYGITDAMIVLVSENKVNITAIGASKVSQVSYAVNASPEEKSKQLAAAEEQVRAKIELKKNSGKTDSRFALYWGAAVSKGFLGSGDKLGVLTGFSIHTSFRLARFIEPHLQLEGYYGLPKDNVSRLLGGSVLAGIGYTYGGNKISFSPYVGAGIFTAQINAAAGTFNVLLPSSGGGFLLTYFISSTWGFTLNTHAQYVFDASTPALFLGTTLATVVRF